MNFSEAATGGNLKKKLLLKNFAIFTGKLQACNFIKKRLQHTYFEEHLLAAASDFSEQLQNSGEKLLLC